MFSFFSSKGISNSCFTYKSSPSLPDSAIDPPKSSNSKFLSTSFNTISNAMGIQPGNSFQSERNYLRNIIMFQTKHIEHQTKLIEGQRHIIEHLKLLSNNNKNESGANKLLLPSNKDNDQEVQFESNIIENAKFDAPQHNGQHGQLESNLDNIIISSHIISGEQECTPEHTPPDLDKGFKLISSTTNSGNSIFTPRVNSSSISIQNIDARNKEKTTTLAFNQRKRGTQKQLDNGSIRSVSSKKRWRMHSFGEKKKLA